MQQFIFACHKINCFSVMISASRGWLVEAAGSSKMLEPLYEITGSHVLKDYGLDTGYHENMRSHTEYHPVEYFYCLFLGLQRGGRY